MSGVYLTGHGGLDKLVYREDIPVPTPQAGEVLIEVKGAGVNNTDINTRLGWYSKKVTSDTNAGGREGLQEVDNDDASWGGVPLQFPRIQGGDICGIIVQVGEGVEQNRIGTRILVRSMQNIPTQLAVLGLVTKAINLGLLATATDYRDTDLRRRDAQTVLERMELKADLIPACRGGYARISLAC